MKHKFPRLPACEILSDTLIFPQKQRGFFMCPLCMLERPGGFFSFLRASLFSEGFNAVASSSFVRPRRNTRQRHNYETPGRTQTTLNGHAENDPLQSRALSEAQARRDWTTIVVCGRQTLLCWELQRPRPMQASKPRSGAKSIAPVDRLGFVHGLSGLTPKIRHANPACRTRQKRHRALPAFFLFSDELPKTTETMDTQTPRTDAEQKWTFGDNRPGMSFECVKVEFAQELEKELAKAKRLLATRVEASRLDDAERRFQYQKEETDKRIVQIRKLQRELADSPKMLGMATDLNLLLQNKADMWRDEFARIKALCYGKPLEWLEVEGICDRAMQDIRSNISLIDQREKAGDMIAKLNEEATATEELLRVYGWKQDESLQMFLHRMKQRPCNPMDHSPEYLSSLLQNCENELAKAKDEIVRLRDYIDHAQRTLNAALTASENKQI